MPVEPAKSAITRDPILVDLALQGGGSHGAFTWGVLRLSSCTVIARWRAMWLSTLKGGGGSYRLGRQGEVP
jgi:hypothetical protein